MESELAARSHEGSIHAVGCVREAALSAEFRAG